jgi:hypothetical protein
MPGQNPPRKGVPVAGLKNIARYDIPARRFHLSPSEL